MGSERPNVCVQLTLFFTSRESVGFPRRRLRTCGFPTAEGNALGSFIWTYDRRRKGFGGTGESEMAWIKRSKTTPESCRQSKHKNRILHTKEMVFLFRYVKIYIRRLFIPYGIQFTTSPSTLPRLLSHLAFSSRHRHNKLGKCSAVDTVALSKQRLPGSHSGANPAQPHNQP